MEELQEIDAVSSSQEIDDLVLLIKDPERYIAQQEAANSLSFYATTNGCSYSPDSWGKADFKPSCDKHDICYSSGSRTNRYTCDTRFYSNLKAECKRVYSNTTVRLSACNKIAKVYYDAVRAFGGSHYAGREKNN